MKYIVRREIRRQNEELGEHNKITEKNYNLCSSTLINWLIWGIRVCTYCTLKYDKWWLILLIRFIEMQLLKRRARARTGAALKHIFLLRWQREISALVEIGMNCMIPMPFSPSANGQTTTTAIKLTSYEILQARARLESSIVECLLIPINKFMHKVYFMLCRDFSTMMCWP